MYNIMLWDGNEKTGLKMRKNISYEKVQEDINTEAQSKDKLKKVLTCLYQDKLLESFKNCIKAGKRMQTK